MLGFVMELRADVAPESRVTWNWVTDANVTVCVAFITIVDVMTVPVVATESVAPASICHEITLVPVPAVLGPIPLDEIVSESPYLYQPSLVSEARDWVTPNPPETVSFSWRS